MVVHTFYVNNNAYSCILFSSHISYNNNQTINLISARVYGSFRINIKLKEYFNY